MPAFGAGTLPAVVVTGLMAGRLFQLGRSQRLPRVVGAGILLLGLASLVFPGLLGADAPASPRRSTRARGVRERGAVLEGVVLMQEEAER